MSQKYSLKQRQDGIVDWVNANGLTQVDALAAMFNTSAVTIRKDLSMLSKAGRLIRQFGGGAPLPKSEQNNLNGPQSLLDDTDESHSVKQGIGAIAAKQVANGARIVIDSGSTTKHMLPFLDRVANLVVMTNALDVANYLTKREPEPTVLMTGGTWDANSQSFQGAMAEQLVSAYDYDFAFIGAAGIDVSRGTTTFNELTGLSRTMAKSAKQVVVMATSSKLSYKMPNLELGWQSISMLITDDGISEQDKTTIEQQGVTVLIASLSGE